MDSGQVREFDLVSRQGKCYSIKLPPPCPKLLRSAFLFGFHKSGSTLMNNMVTRYCDKIDQPVFSLYDSAFMQGVSTQDIQADAAQCFEKQGYIYTGFRHFPGFDMDLDNAVVVLLTRDPRDMLVSNYYSTRSSHVIPAGLAGMIKRRAEAVTIGVDEFVLKQKHIYGRLLTQYRHALGKNKVTIYRYEDVIYDKENWLSDLIDELHLENIQKEISSVAKQFDIIPASENENRHIRQVHPGNYKEKLEQSTIQELNESLADFLTYFNYEF